MGESDYGTVLQHLKMLAWFQVKSRWLPIIHFFISSAKNTYYGWGYYDITVEKL